MKSTIHFLLICIVVVAFSCLENYEPPVVAATTNYLVVDGYLDANGSATVKLSRAFLLKSQGPAKKETGAVVTIVDEAGGSFNLDEIKSGFYSAFNLNVNVASKYRLKITTSNSKEYLSDYITLKISPAIDSINYKPENEGLRIFVNTHDASGKTRYYKWNFEETWHYNTTYEASYTLVNGVVSQLSPFEKVHECWNSDTSNMIYIASTERLSEDLVSEYQLTFIPRASQKLSRKYSIIVKQQALSEFDYQYWSTLQKMTENLGGLFDPLPSELYGNIHALTNTDETVIGLFSGGKVSSKRIFIATSDLPPNYSNYLLAECKVDSLMNDKLAELKNYKYLIDPIYYSNGDPGVAGYSTSHYACIDCTLMGGETTMPDFWE